MKALFSCIMLLVFAVVSFSTARAQENEPVTLHADSLTYLQEEGHVFAEGNVELRQGAWILLADKLTYDEATGMINASGNIALATPGGEVVFADEANFTEALRYGEVSKVSMRLVDDSRLVARSASLRGEQSFLEQAVYSVCQPCEESERGVVPPPIWQVKAYKVERNEGEGIIQYEDASLEFFGVPIFYTPFLFHTDPSIPKRSGILLPGFFSSSHLGLGVEIPFFWNVAPNYDLTFVPRFYSDGDVLWQSEWRHLTQTGRYNLDAAAVLESRANRQPGVTEGFRGAFFGEGRFQPLPEWFWGFDINTTTDDTFPRRFDLSQETQFTSTLFLERFNEEHQLRINGYHFQGLLEGDSQSQSPIILPLMEYTRRLPGLYAGGRATLEGSFLVLAREKGVQSRRLSTSVTWDREFFDNFGSVYEVKTQIRGDIYHVENVPHRNSEGDRRAEFIERFLPTAGFEWRFPLARTTSEGRVLVEPIAQLLLSPHGGNPEGIPNEDSESFELDETNLFAVDKFSGLDLWEDGERLRYGVRAVFLGSEGQQGSVLFGQEYRFESQDSFAELTGIKEQASDYVGSSHLEWQRLRFEQRFRLNQENFHIRLHDVGISTEIIDGFEVSARYAYLSEDISTTQRSEAEIYLRGNYNFLNDYNAYTYLRRDLSGNKLLYNGIGVSYSDECFLAQLELRNDFRRDRDVGPESALFFRIVLVGLGEWDGISEIENNE
ncbi:MAG: LPS assembly protein LptD [Hyphomicrobiales bacterium]|nr:LPS assembly protein LptD [Hyphomicrobiales bacterium]